MVTDDVESPHHRLPQKDPEMRMPRTTRRARVGSSRDACPKRTERPCAGRRRSQVAAAARAESVEHGTEPPKQEMSIRAAKPKSTQRARRSKAPRAAVSKPDRVALEGGRTTMVRCAMSEERLMSQVERSRETLRSRLTCQKCKERPGQCVCDPQKCQHADCGVDLYWFMHDRTGKYMCLDAAGDVHWPKCPGAEGFRKGKP